MIEQAPRFTKQDLAKVLFDKLQMSNEQVKELTSNSDLMRDFQNVKQIYLRGILTRKLYDPFIFLTPY